MVIKSLHHHHPHPLPSLFCFPGSRDLLAGGGPVDGAGVCVVMGYCVAWLSGGDDADFTPQAEPHVVTEEEVRAGVYSITDVVLPLPGKNIRYPEHASAQVRIEP